MQTNSKRILDMEGIDHTVLLSFHSADKKYVGYEALSGTKMYDKVDAYMELSITCANGDGIYCRFIDPVNMKGEDVDDPGTFKIYSVDMEKNDGTYDVTIATNKGNFMLSTVTKPSIDRVNAVYPPSPIIAR